MAITTGASDAGATLLDVGGRAKAGPSRGNGGNSFADTLDTHLRPTRQGAARAQAGAKGETPEKNSISSAPRTAAHKSRDGQSAAKADEQKSAETGESTATEETAGDGAEARADEAPRGDAEGAAVAATDPAGGNILPPAAIPATATTSDPAAEATAAAETDAVRGGAPRGTAAAQIETASEEAPRGEGEAAASGAATNKGTATADGSAPGARNTDALLQAMRLGVSNQAEGNAKSEKAEAFAATLGAIRDARTGDPAAFTANPAAGGTHLATTTPAATTANAAASTATVSVPVGEQGWNQAMGERVVWMTRHGLQEAKIELHPRDLGPVEVRVSVQQDQASVTFTAHHPAAREALEAALPRLREMLADSGLNLAQSGVFQQSPQQRQDGGDGSHPALGLAPAAVAADEGVAVIAQTPIASRSAVDYYA